MVEYLNQRIKTGKEEKIWGENEVKVKQKEGEKQVKSKHLKGEVIKRREYNFSLVSGQIPDLRQTE